MRKLFQRLFRIFRTTEYEIEGKNIRIFKHRKKAVVYIDDVKVFSNLKNNDSFKKWWNDYKRDKNEIRKLKRKEKERKFIGYMVTREAEDPKTRKWDQQKKN